MFKELNLSALHNPAKWLAKLLLRRVHSDEQIEELKGISQAAGVEMYLLVAFNTLIDMFIACTSGGMKASDGHKNNLLHFRTLDLGMPMLRRLIVQFEYVDRLHGKVVAKSVGYVALVGIFTGVKPGLSLSLNSRCCYKRSRSTRRNVKYFVNHLAVVFRLRPPIASRLRKYMLPKEGRALPTLAELTSEFPSITTTTCYLIACDGDKTTVFEKDVNKAQIRSSTDFIAVTNHDQACESDNTKAGAIATVTSQPVSRIANSGHLAETIDRKKCLEDWWRLNSILHCDESCEDDCITMEDLQTLMETHPTANDHTHFAAMMDPKEGEIVWCRRWIDLLEELSDRGSLLGEKEVHSGESE